MWLPEAPPAWGEDGVGVGSEEGEGEDGEGEEDQAADLAAAFEVFSFG